MSSRQSSGRNTLLNYFNRVPCESKGNRDKEDDNLGTLTSICTQEKRQLHTEDDEDCENIQPMKRRKRIIEENTSSDDESNVSSNDALSKFMMTPTKSSQKRKIKSDSPTPKKSNKSSNSSTKMTSTSSPQITFSSSTQMTPSSSVTGNKAIDHTWLHDKLEFLQPNKIRDKNMKRPDELSYDRRTLYVPQEFISKQTPAMQQWWTLKRDHFDCVLFFKVGKFYELYHMDAVIGVNELGFSYMKGEFAHSGFPESAYGRMVSTLVELGYKVARVEQTETPEAMHQRLQKIKKGFKQNKVVTREICQITNKGTRVQGLQDLEIKKSSSTYLLAIKEKRPTINSREFGVCFVDTSIGVFYLGQFTDDDIYSRLLTMLAQFPAAVILEQRNELSIPTRSVLKTATDNAVIESLSLESQFMSSTKTLQMLQENEYFKKRDDGKINLPVVLQGMISEDDPLNITCKKEYELAIRCLGACMWYLKDCLLDIQLLSMGKFQQYIPPDMDIVKTTSISKFMILDASAMSSLNIFEDNYSLERILDHCCTAMGKRLLHQWICKPLCNVEEIRERQDAISELIQNPHIMIEARASLKKMPDLERLISRIHCLGNGLRARNHPDSRAIFYEEKTYSKKKIQYFMKTLNGFESAATLRNTLESLESKMLVKYMGVSTESQFPEIMGVVEFFKNSFDNEEAEREGKIIPQKGVDEEYDDAMQEIESIQNDLSDYLKSQEKFFGCAVSYFGTDKKRFQLDVPEHAAQKANANYFLEGTKKGSKPTRRYTTNETKALLAKMMAAEKRSNEVLHDINRRIFEKFSEKYEDWSFACYCLAVLDVLLSLAQYTLNQSTAMCVPEVLPFSSTPALNIQDGVHPCLSCLKMNDFVANDTNLGINGHANIMIISGANMGGKSTIMRQVALLAIMAQLGCHVPAAGMKMTLVDRIFTRLGARDDIITGNSTFLVEMKESSAILKHATKNSLVLLDELGRGTATYDGTAIATTFVKDLIQINCRTIFSTHYFSLLEFFEGNENVFLAHMACKVEADGDATKETVTFMYKLAAGPCPKSYGFNAARLAGIPRCVTTRARLVSQKLEAETIARKLFRKLLCDVNNAREMLDAMSI